jgi:hypothetical protein
MCVYVLVNNIPFLFICRLKTINPIGAMRFFLRKLQHEQPSRVASTF